MAINFDQAGADAVPQGGVSETAADPREQQVAGGYGAWIPLWRQAIRRSDDLAAEARQRAAGSQAQDPTGDILFGAGSVPPQPTKPLLTDALSQPSLLDEKFDAAQVWRELDQMPDPRVGAPTTPAGSPLSSDEGINFQWFDFGSDSDPFKAIELIAGKLPPKGTVTWEKTHAGAKKALAEELDILPHLLEGQLNLSARNITAARMLLAKSSSRMKHWAETGAQGDRQALYEFRRQALVHRGIVLGVRQMRSEAGRTLNALRMTVSDADADKAVMFLDEFGGPGQTEAMAKMYLRLREMNGEAAANRFVNQASVLKTMDGMMEVYVHGMLSNPTTIEKVILGNLQAFILNPLDDLAAGIVGKILPRGADQSQALLLSPAVRMQAWVQSFGDGAAAFYRTLKTAQPVDAIGRLDGATPVRALDRSAFSPENQNSMFAHGVHYFGQIIRANVERGMASVDAFTKTLIANGEKRVGAYEAGNELHRAGVPIDDVLDEVARLSIDPKHSRHGFGDQLLARQARASGRATLTEPLSGRMQRFGQPWRMLDQNKVTSKLWTAGGMAINTFWRVTARAFTETYRRTPMGVVLPSVRKALAAGGAERDKALGQMAMGSMLMGYFFQQALEGRLTGAGPRGDMSEKLRKQGIDIPPKFSFYLGEDENGKRVYRSYSGMEPIGGIIAIATTLAEAYKYGEPEGEEFENMIAAAAMLPVEYLGELPFARSITSFAGFIRNIANREVSTDNAIKSMGELTSMFAQVLPNSTIPFSSVRRAIERDVDPEIREAGGAPTSRSPVAVGAGFHIWQRTYRDFLKVTPGFSKNLPDSRNVFGDPRLTNEDPGWAQYFMPFRKKTSKLDEVEQTYIALGIANNELPFVKPRAKVRGINITPQMHADWMEAIYAKSPRARMLQVMKKTEYGNAMVGNKTALMATLLNAEYEEIKNEAILETFGYDVDRKKFVGNSRHDNIGQALLVKAERIDQGYPINRMFDD